MHWRHDPRGLMFATAVALALVSGLRGGVALAQPPDAAADRAALEAFYDATGGASWTADTNWKTSAPLGDWHGVTTDASGRVTRLELGDNGLTGSIPSTLGSLANLEWLNLSSNQLSGPIPIALGRLANLFFLNLSRNELSGSVPPWLGDMSSLLALYLSGNELTGGIPDELANLNLWGLGLSWNDMSVGPIPAWLRNHTNLRWLYLSGSDVTGGIPAWLGNLVNLESLFFSANDLTGPIPSALAGLENLENLDLSYNWGVSGSLPSGLGRARLEGLDILVTQACAPAAWQGWLATIEFTGRLCGAPTDVEIDVAVVYTPAARDAAGGVAAIEAEIDLMVAETNQAYEASGVDHRVALVDRSEVPYTETGDSSLDLGRLLDPSDGHLDDVHALRDRVGADLVHLIIGEADDICGRAYRPGVFGLTVQGCGGRTLAHELGHNMGLLHDRYEEHHNVAGVLMHPAYGYVNQRAFEAGVPPSSRWRTIMAYNSQCDDADFYCRTPLRFSNPRLQYNGDPLGVPYGAGGPDVTGPADAVAVLNSTGPAVALWRDRVAAGANRPPVPVGTLPDRTLAPDSTLSIDVSQAFVDPDGDALSYAVSSSPPRVVTARVAGADVTLTAVGVGTATIRVTATDPGGLSAALSFTVTVRSAPTGDRAVLEAFYDATGGASWTTDTSWKTSAALGDWYGVTTDSSGRVTELELPENGLSGSIPADLGSLASLRRLSLYSNALTGAIPNALGRLGNLFYLELSWNRLSGPVPAWLGDMPSLGALYLSGNELTGGIPAELGRLDLRGLGLGWNDLSVGPIPTWLGNLTNLRWLYLSRSGLTGSIPGALGRLANLRHLYLNRNALTGLIPPWLGNLAGLERLYLGGNPLTGSFPDVLLGNLERLGLDYAWGLSGPLPSGLRLPSLEELDIFVTQACAPAPWRDWLATIEFTGPLCGAETSVEIDVAVVYTPAARAAAGGAAAIGAVIDLMVADTNGALAASGVQHRVALVERSEVAYAETGDSVVDFRRLRDPSDGYLDAVHAVRDRVGADLVHLIVGETEADSCGRASVAGAFGLTRQHCGGRGFAAGLGLNMGLRQDRYRAGGGSPAHPAYGYVNQRAFDPGAPGAAPSRRWRTIASFSDQCDDAGFRCPALLRFSNPRQLYDGDPLGIPYGAGGIGVTGSADAAAVLGATGPAVALWRDAPSGRTNRPPAAVGRLPDRTLELDDTLEVDVAHAFVDPDGDALTYGASSSATSVASVSVAGSTVTVTPAAPGAATLTVTATDTGGSNRTATQSFTVTVPRPFTDHPIVRGVTPIKAIHFTELRTRIDSLRAAAGLARFAWTDPVLTPGVTPVRLLHLLDLRSALVAAYTAAGQSAPRWTDAAPVGSTTPVRTEHMMELRAAVVALQ